MPKSEKGKEVIFEVGSLEWLAARSKNVTATEVASLFGLNKYKSANALIKDKVAPKKIWSQHIRRGRILEPAVLQALREDMGWDSELYGGTEGVSFYQYPAARLSATPDGKLLNDKGKVTALIELKTANNARMDDWDYTVPPHYALQVHAQMMCVGIDKAYIACLGAFDPFPLIVYEIEHNQRIVDLITKVVTKFWDDFENKTPFVVDKMFKKDMTDWLRIGSKRVY